MKLFNKLLIFTTSSKVIVAIIFITSLPFLVSWLSQNYTDQLLISQKQRVLQTITEKGIDHYLEGEDGYGSYTLLKDEYISIESIQDVLKDSIKTTQRVIENDTLNYRVLSHYFSNSNKNYLLEIGKTADSIVQYYAPLQKFALAILFIIIALTLAIDFIFSKKLVAPLDKIVRGKIFNSKFPFDRIAPSVKTSTSDFASLDQSLTDLMQQVNQTFYKEREFIANASHEFMTPISIIQNKIDNLLLDDSLAETAKIKLIEIMNTVSRLKKISKSLLLISRIESSQFIKNDEVDINLVVTEILEELAIKAEILNLKISINLPKQLILMHTNQTLVFQLFYNLINNALKFNLEDGFVSITHYFETSRACTIEVKNSGFGIAETDLPKLFDRFKKFNNSVESGFGLGLSIVRSISQELGLPINAKSSSNGPTSFFIEIPFKLIRLRQ